MRGGRGCAVGLVLACTLLSACNEPDYLAGPPDVGSQLGDGGGDGLDCKLPAQLARSKLPIGLANVFTTCEWQLDRKDSPDDLHWFFWDLGVEADQDHLCDLNPYRYWQEPRWGVPRKVVFCPKACELVQNAVNCILKLDICYDDAGIEANCDFQWPPIDPCRVPIDDDAGRPPFCPGA